jgi:hypothetical protein
VRWTTSAGTIDVNGNYTAPASVPDGGTATVTATSSSNHSAFSSAIVTVTTKAVSLRVSPQNSKVKAGLSQIFTATVVGTTNTSVNWSVNDLPGDTSPPGVIVNGNYTAPAPVVMTNTFSVTATSNADPTKTASASVTVTPLENQEQQAFPIKLGASGVNANADCCSGTLGSLLADENGKQYILSNNHILGRVGHADVGEAIVQPGYVETGCNFALPNTVAHFTAAPPIETANVDAAIAEVVSGAVDSHGEIIGLGGIASDGSYIPAPPANTTVNAFVGMAVSKSGRTTGLSCGNVTGVNAMIRIDLAPDCGNPTNVSVLFDDQIVLGNIANYGDSGSLNRGDCHRTTSWNGRGHSDHWGRNHNYSKSYECHTLRIQDKHREHLRLCRWPTTCRLMPHQFRFRNRHVTSANGLIARPSKRITLH